MQKTIKCMKRAAYAASLVPAIVLAQVPGAVEPISGNEDLTLLDVIQNVITYILGFAAAIAVLFLIIGGIRYMASAGNSDNIDAAKHTILYSVIGLLIIVLSFIIVTFVSSQLGGAIAS